MEVASGFRPFQEAARKNIRFVKKTLKYNYREFEKVKKGDCEDFALWTWRQFIDLGYQTRFVVGKAGGFGTKHAWVTIQKNGKNYIVEPQACSYGARMPSLVFIRYEPERSIEWNGKSLRFFVHERPDSILPISTFAFLVVEWLFFWFKVFSGLLAVENFLKDKLVVE